MYYHASPVGGIRQLEPRISNHGVPLIYFSRKRENVLVYLSNAIEKYCRDRLRSPGAVAEMGPLRLRQGRHPAPGGVLSRRPDKDL